MGFALPGAWAKAPSVPSSWLLAGLPAHDRDLTVSCTIALRHLGVTCSLGNQRPSEGMSLPLCFARHHVCQTLCRHCLSRTPPGAVTFGPQDNAEGAEPCGASVMGPTGHPFRPCAAPGPQRLPPSAPPHTQGVPGVPAALEQATMRQFAGGPEDAHVQVSAWRGQSRAARCERDLGAGEFCAMVGGAWGPRYAFAAYFPLTGGPRSPLTLSPAVWAQLVSQPPLTTSTEAPDAVCA